MRCAVLMRAIICVLCLVLAKTVWADGLLVVVNLKAPVTKLSMRELSMIYRLHRRFWPNDLPIVPVNLEASSEERQTFSHLVFNRSTMELADYWNRQRFQGKMPPVVQTSDQSVVGFVKTVPGAIGYISDSTEHDGVKVVARLE